MKSEGKTIREHVARAKAYANRNDVVRTLDAVCEALRLLAGSQVFGKDKIETEITLDEGLRTISGLPRFRKLFPSGLALRKGQERQLYLRLKTLRDKIREAIKKAEMEKMRAYKNAIDKAILGAQKLLDEGNVTEARLLFRKASEQFAEEPGIFQDIGTRMLRGGLTAECVEYLERAIETAPRDPRPYGSLETALEALGELEKAVDVTKNALRNFGPNDRTYQILARLFLKMKKWDEAYDMAQASLDLNPFNREAAQIEKQLKSKVFGRSQGQAPGEGGGKAISLDF